MFGIFAAGTGLGPLAMGAGFDALHSYGAIFIGFEVVLLIACVLLLRLGPYPFPPERRSRICVAAWGKRCRDRGRDRPRPMRQVGRF